MPFNSLSEQGRPSQNIELKLKTYIGIFQDNILAVYGIFDYIWIIF